MQLDGGEGDGGNRKGKEEKRNSKWRYSISNNLPLGPSLQPHARHCPKPLNFILNCRGDPRVSRDTKYYRRKKMGRLAKEMTLSKHHIAFRVGRTECDTAE